MGEQSDAKEACLWSVAPGTSRPLTVDEVALKTAYYSGGAAAIERFVNRLNGIIREGTEASQELQNIDKTSQSKA